MNFHGTRFVTLFGLIAVTIVWTNLKWSSLSDDHKAIGIPKTPDFNGAFDMDELIKFEANLSAKEASLHLDKDDMGMKEVISQGNDVVEADDAVEEDDEPKKDVRGAPAFRPKDNGAVAGEYQCTSVLGNSIFQHGNYPDATGIMEGPWWRKHTEGKPVLPPSLDGALQCLDDLDKDSKGKPIFPDPYSSEMRVPFFILPTHMPKDDSGKTWEECWDEYDEMPGQGTHEKDKPLIFDFAGSPGRFFMKRMWTIHAVKQLASHPWRVHSPEEAFVFVSPLMDYDTAYKPKSAACKRVFPYDRGLAIEKEGKEWKDYLSTTNRLVLFGGYFHMIPWHEKRFGKLGGGVDPDNDVILADPVKSPVAADFSRDLRRTVQHPKSMFMQMSVEPLCFLGENHPRTESRMCKVTEDQFEEPDMTVDEWLQAHPYNFSAVFSHDSRAAYATRHGMITALNWAMANNRKVLKKFHPYVYFAFERFTPKKIQEAQESGVYNEPRLATCTKEADQYQAWLDGKPSLDDNEVSGETMQDLITTDMIHHVDGFQSDQGDHSLDSMIRAVTMGEKVEDFMSFDLLYKSHTMSRASISLRGDCLHSQRSNQGLYFGQMTIHDITEDAYAFHTQGPGHLPYRLFGLFDNGLCIHTHTRVMKHHSKRKELYTMIMKDMTPSNNAWTDAEVDKWSDRFMECLDPMNDWFAHKGLTEAMFLSIKKYRDYAIWETRHSKAAEMILVELARLSIKGGERQDELDRLGIKRDWFDNVLPKSCLLSGGDGPYEKHFTMEAGSVEQKELMKDILKELNVY